MALRQHGKWRRVAALQEPRHANQRWPAVRRCAGLLDRGGARGPAADRVVEALALGKCFPFLSSRFPGDPTRAQERSPPGRRGSEGEGRARAGQASASRLMGVQLFSPVPAP